MTYNVAELLVDSLIANDFRYLYCLPGVQNDDFFDALYDKQDQLTPIHTRHEQAAAYMALGAALATGKPQAFSVVPGPGFLNASAALSTAYAVNAPLLALVGQIPSPAIGKEFGLLHEINGQLDTLNNLTKHTERTADGDRAADIITTALRQLKSGRPRPVGIETPVNVWKQPTSVESGNNLVISAAANPVPDSDMIAQAIQIIQQAKCPLIIVGSGAQNSSETVTQLAEGLSAPVAAFRTGHGVLSADNPLHISLPEAHALWKDCDLVLGLGTRLQTQKAWGIDDALNIIHIDIDAEVPARVSPDSLGIHAALEDALPTLLGDLPEQPDRTAWLDTIRRTKQRFEAIYQKKLAPQLEWLAAIRDELPPEGIFVDELTQVGYVSRFAFPVYQPRTFLSTGYQGTLGWGFATALGAAHARPDVPVVSISGDGGALYTLSELATAAQHNIPLTSIIFKDNAFGNVKRFQIENYNNRPIASDLSNPDFVKLAESFGVRGLRANTPEALREHLKTVLFDDAPTVIEVPVGDFPSPWDFILMPKVRG
ncbi:MAG: thiamine pyrophosphate-dependent enzyme [Thiolinea sp.]